MIVLNREPWDRARRAKLLVGIALCLAILVAAYDMWARLSLGPCDNPPDTTTARCDEVDGLPGTLLFVVPLALCIAGTILASWRDQWRWLVVLAIVGGAFFVVEARHLINHAAGFDVI